MDLDSYDQPNILFLRGCFLTDCSSIEDLFDERIIDEAMPDNKLYDIKSIVYDKIPDTFTSVESWIKKTNLKCWSCDCNFHNIPIFIPRTLEKSSDPTKMCGSMEPLGNFCSWNCASAYAHLHYRENLLWELLENLKLLHRMFTGEIIDDIRPSIPKTKMQQYGGEATVDEYKQTLNKLNDVYGMMIEKNKIKNLSIV